MVHRHLAVMTFEITLLDAAAPVVVSSQLMNRQDGEDEYHVKAAALGEGMDPRKARKFSDRVLRPRLQREHENEIILGYRCNHSGMTLACGTRHMIETACDVEVTTQVSPDLAKTVFSVRATVGEPIRITKLVTYHSSTGVPAEELADRCTRSLGRAETDGVDALLTEQTRVVRRLLDGERHRTPRRRQGAAGDPLEPLPARPGLGAHARAGHRREGRHRWRLRRPLLLGHRGLRRAVPRLHRPGSGAQGGALPLGAARRAPASGRRR